MVRRRLFLGSLATLGVVAGLLVSGQAAQATVAFTLYASPSGSGSACSSSAPCSLDQAKSTAHDDAAAASGDIDVVLADGTYQLSSTLAFTGADSVSGSTVTYEAAAGAHPILSGGVPVTATWNEIDTTRHIYEALVPDTKVTAATRQIYVNGVRAGVDTKNTATVFTSMSPSTDGAGYTYTATGPDSWTNTGDVDFVYPGTAAGATQWTSSVCPATSIGSGKVTMAEPCWDLRHDFNWGTPSAVQNNQALLGTPGQFYLDMHSTADANEHQLYYVPRPGENMSTAQVIVPQLQTLVQLTGASGITFQGIGFEYGTWTIDETGATGSQEGSLWQGPDPVTTQKMLHPNVLCNNCTDVTFTGDTFTHLGGSGLGFDQGGANNTITGNIVTDISGDGIQVGDLGAPWTLVTGTVINDNYVSDVSKEYLNGAGIFTGVVSGTTIDHNEVSNIPYDGITVGGPVSGTIVQGNNKVENNYVHDVMGSNLRDGGPIYVTGYQSSTIRSTIRGNYITDDPQPFGSIYLDSGASYWDVSNNVVSGYANSWVFVQYGNGAASYNNHVTDNYVDARAGAGSGNYGVGTGNTQSGNQTGLTDSRWPAAAQTVMGQAGLELAYQGLNPASPQTNLALARPATDTTGTPTGKGNDGVAGTVFSTTAVSGTAHWQVDMGSLHALSHLQILERTDGNVPDELANLQVLVSNSPSLTTGTTTAPACTTGSLDLPAMSLWDCALPAGPWRYVTIEKTDGQALAFSEAHVFGTAATVTTVDDTAPGISYTGTWTAENSSPHSRTNYNVTQQITATNGDSVSYTFYGTGINVISALDTNRGRMSVAIDGVSSQTVSCASTTLIYQQTCAGVSGLAAGTHTITVTKVDGSYMSLDAFQVIAPYNIAQTASTTASSVYGSAYPASNAIDGISRLWGTGEWASAGVQNPWLTLTWASAVPVTQVTFFDRPNTTDNANGGTLTFSNGDTVPVTGIPTDGTPRTVTFPEENTTSIKFQVAGGAGTNVGLSEMAVADTRRPDLALTATATASSAFASTYSPVAAVDGITGISDVGEWASNGELNPWLKLVWSSSQTINHVTIYDRPNTTDNANGGTLTFSDGHTVPVSAIPTNGTPVTVSFPAETTTSLTFQVSGGAGYNVGLSELEASNY
ncbi:DUF7402 domain-containing protein [Diaminobutyricibacter sp. McL0608]|uniref:DUF7402 domain-containing protein n=1 Tax=Leifsonia sp. McL0608 TaxID=3143537 RepID=UPI0031F32D8B